MYTYKHSHLHVFLFTHCHRPSYHTPIGIFKFIPTPSMLITMITTRNERKYQQQQLLLLRWRRQQTITTKQNEFKTDAASVVVHVIHGEHPAAMQYGNSSANSLFHSFFASYFSGGRNRNYAIRCSSNTVAARSSAAIQRQNNVITTTTAGATTSTITFYLMLIQELLSSRLNIIIHAISKQFPNTMFYWLFHYVIGNIIINSLIATTHRWL